jgi:hypothetical protein
MTSCCRVASLCVALSLELWGAPAAAGDCFWPSGTFQCSSCCSGTEYMLQVENSYAGASNQAIAGESAVSPGVGVAGTSDAYAGLGVVGGSFNGDAGSTGVGVYGVSSGGNGVGVSGLGIGVGVYATAASDGGIAVYGVASDTDMSDDGCTGNGVQGLSSAPSGVGVFGEGLGYGTSGVVGTSADGTSVVAMTSSASNCAVVATAPAQTDCGLHVTDIFQFDTNVGINGPPSTTYYFAVNDSTSKPSANNTGVWQTSSDVRLKKNIQTLDGALESFLRLQGVSYEWQEPQKHGDLTGKQRGFIAQDVERVFPDWVTTDADGYESLSVNAYPAVAVEAFREVKQRNDALKARLETLHDRLEQLNGHTSPVAKFGWLDWTLVFGGSAAGLALGRRRRRAAQVELELPDRERSAGP